jgi:hypothetical protein
VSHLFQVNTTNPKKLDKEMGDMFHQNVAKLLFLCKWARLDLQMAVAFLCTRVKDPNTDDYKKLARAMKYLYVTKTLPMRLEADNSGLVSWWIDGSFAVHPNMKSHTGGTMSLGKGSPYSTSKCQKINMKSSMEAELMVVDDVIPQIIWSKNFLEAQGYIVNDNVVFRKLNSWL